ncbi:MAG: non-canonical purine NTP pyrophosphatase [Candidatus Paceibacterota bacterium]|jgi:non-canonical purine NTP pyrophosphatase (RdgB/HAM1 family)
MKTINYITGNKFKFDIVKTFFDSLEIKVKQKELPIYEIQGHDAIEITTSKARQAWELIQEPLFVNDAFWIIPSLKGFPGPYMKYMNDWFEPKDFLNLMKDKKDRTIILRDTIVYIDKNGQNVFTSDHYGKILETPAGDYKYPSDAIISLSKNNKSIAEENETNNFFTEGVWVDFANWLKIK